MMSKRKKVLTFLCVIVLGAVCVGLLQQPNEPKYNGRYLSEWMAMPNGVVQAEETKRSILAIGTNALPCYTQWIRYEPAEWRASLYNKLPFWMKQNPMVDRWLIGPSGRAHWAVIGIWTLGTNAACAIPELTMIMRDGTKPTAAYNAIDALAGIGEPAIPVLKAALADTNQVDRWHIVEKVAWLAYAGHTNACVPILIESLNDSDAEVRRSAKNVIQNIAPHLLTNAPSP